MTTMDFAPLVLPVSSVSEGLESNYKIIKTTGEAVVVEASSAAEAMEKSGIKNPLRIISIAQEQRRLMARNLLHPQDSTVQTNIDTENFVPDFRSLVVENLEEEEPQPFEECSLAELSVRRLDKLPEKPKPAPKPEPVVEQAPPPPPVEESTLIAVEKEPAPPLPPPSEQEIIPPDRELTPEEVDALMNAKPSGGQEADDEA